MSVFANCKFWAFFLAAMYVIPLTVAGVSYYFDDDDDAKKSYPEEVFALGNLLTSASFVLVIIATASFVDYMSRKESAAMPSL